MLGSAVALATSAWVAPAAQAGWLPPVDISASGKTVQTPRVVLDADGNGTAVWSRWNGQDMVVEGAYRPAGEAWQAPEALSEAGPTTVEGEHNATYPRIAVDAQGNTTVVWERYAGENGLEIQAAYRPAGGSWQAAVTISSPDNSYWAEEPWVAMDAQGDATAVWNQAGVIETAYRPAGGEWEAPVTLSGSGTTYTPQAAVDAQGDATAVWMYSEGSRFVVQEAYRPAGGAWGPAEDLSAEGEEGNDPQIALDGRGDTLVVWSKPERENLILRDSYRAAGGAWQAPETLAEEESADTDFPRLALDPEGNAVAVWSAFGKGASSVGGYDTVKSTYRPAGGTWEATKTLSSGQSNAVPSDVTFDQSGNAVVVWEQSNSTEDVVYGDYRPASEEWQAPVALSEAGKAATGAVVALDAVAQGNVTTPVAQGDATAVWEESNGTETTIQAAGYDTKETTAEDVAAPELGAAQAPLEFSISSTDAYSPRWEFGDGTSATGTKVTHAYAATGKYTVTVSSTDLLGYPSSIQRTVAITQTGSAPSVSKVTPASGSTAGGATVTITGAGLAEASAVEFGPGRAAQFKVISETEIQAVAPPWSSGNAIAEVTVTTPAGTTHETPLEDSFIYEPKVTKIEPASGPASGGTRVTISGEAFEGLYGGGYGEMAFVSSVQFGSQPSKHFQVDPGGRTITALSPPGVGTAEVTVTTLGGTSALSAFGGFVYTMPLIDEESSSGVTSSDATLQAHIDPEGQAVHYQFQLVGDPSEYPAEMQCPAEAATGPAIPCIGPKSAGALPIGSLPAGNEVQAVSLDLGSAGVALVPGRTYHYRVLVARARASEDTLEWEAPYVQGPDQTFTTPEPTSSAGGQTPGGTASGLLQPLPSATTTTGLTPSVPTASPPKPSAARRHHRKRRHHRSRHRHRMRHHRVGRRRRS